MCQELYGGMDNLERDKILLGYVSNENISNKNVLFCCGYMYYISDDIVYEKTLCGSGCRKLFKVCKGHNGPRLLAVLNNFLFYIDSHNGSKS